MNIIKYFTQPRQVTVGEFWVAFIAVLILGNTWAQGSIEHIEVKLQKENQRGHAIVKNLFEEEKEKRYGYDTAISDYLDIECSISDSVLSCEQTY